MLASSVASGADYRREETITAFTRRALLPRSATIDHLRYLPFVELKLPFPGLPFLLLYNPLQLASILPIRQISVAGYFLLRGNLYW